MSDAGFDSPRYSNRIDASDNATVFSGRNFALALRVDLEKVGSILQDHYGDLRAENARLRKSEEKLKKKLVTQQKTCDNLNRDIANLRATATRSGEDAAIREYFLALALEMVKHARQEAEWLRSELAETQTRIIQLENSQAVVLQEQIAIEGIGSDPSLEDLALTQFQRAEEADRRINDLTRENEILTRLLSQYQKMAEALDVPEIQD